MNARYPVDFSGFHVLSLEDQIRAFCGDFYEIAADKEEALASGFVKNPPMLPQGATGWFVAPKFLVKNKKPDVDGVWRRDCMVRHETYSIIMELDRKDFFDVDFSAMDFHAVGLQTRMYKEVYERLYTPAALNSIPHFVVFPATFGLHEGHIDSFDSVALKPSDSSYPLSTFQIASMVLTHHKVWNTLSHVRLICGGDECDIYEHNADMNTPYDGMFNFTFLGKGHGNFSAQTKNPPSPGDVYDLDHCFVPRGFVF